MLIIENGELKEVADDDPRYADVPVAEIGEWHNYLDTGIMGG